MRIVVALAAVVAACALALAAPVDKPGGPAMNNGPGLIRPALVVAGPSSGGSAAPFDADRDGYTVTFDCNDDDPAANPAAVELANGTDDNCNGVVDDGFDTTIDWPRIQMARAIWPLAGAEPVDLISPEAAPRIVWNGRDLVFMAVWADAGDSLHFARIDATGALVGRVEKLADAARKPDAVWTGSRMAIIYEDYSTGSPAIRFVTLDPASPWSGFLADTVLAAGTDPRIVWGQDRFGVVWMGPQALNPVRFQRFDLNGMPLSRPEYFDSSGSKPAISFSGTSVRIVEGRADIHDGSFGIVYEGYWGAEPTGDVYLTSRPREATTMAPAGPVRVNQHDDPPNKLGTMPVVAASPAGFVVCWHTVEGDLDRAQARFFSSKDLAPVQEFTPDLDAGREGRMAWTGAEFVMVNDNIVNDPPTEYAVHFRRIDPSGNTHLAAGWGPWNELNLSAATRGLVSTHPDVANTGDVLGVAWIQQDATSGELGRLWFAAIAHK